MKPLYVEVKPEGKEWVVIVGGFGGLEAKVRFEKEYMAKAYADRMLDKEEKGEAHEQT